MAYTLFTQSLGLEYANSKVYILEAVTGTPATILGSALGGVVNETGLATLSSTGVLSVFIDTARTWQVTIIDENFSNSVSDSGRVFVYAQPSSSTVWADRPNGLVIPLPAWAKKLTLGLSTGGGGGGSGRRGATLTTRSGGAGGQAGTAVQWTIPLLDSAGVQLGATVTLTVGTGSAGGAAILIDDTSGNSSAGTGLASSLLFAGTTYYVGGGGTAAGGGTSSAAANSGSASSAQFQISNAQSASTSANALVGYPSGPSTPGGPGGSINGSDVLLTPGTISHISSLPVAIGISTTAGASGAGQRNGVLFSARGGNGGSSSISAAAQAGGNGIYGAGGGGGGASQNGFASGAGGAGGHGWAVLFWE